MLRAARPIETSAMGESTAPSPEIGKKFAPDDLEFVSETNAAMLEQSPTGGRLILWASVLFIAIALIWAAYAQVDEVTRGVGKVIPSQQMQIVQNLEGGILAEMLVKEGEIVDKDQIILRIDDTRFSSSLREGSGNYLALKAKAARLKAESDNTAFIAPEDVMQKEPQIVEQEAALFRSRQQELESNVGILKQQVSQRRQELAELRGRRDQLSRSHKLTAQELTMTKPLVAEGAISEVEVLRLERQVNEVRGELSATELAIPRVQSTYDEAVRKIEDMELAFRNKARVEYNETAVEVAKLSESNFAMKDRVSRTAVRSPVRGTVNRLLMNTAGGVIQPGMNLVEIVPLDDSLLIEARVRPSDIGFIHPGQKAIVKFSAYDFGIYGGLEATVDHISADTIRDNEKEESYYLVRVRTKQSYLGTKAKPLPIIPGMLADTDILTGKKTVMHYLLKPVLKAKERALTER
ncbi:MAG: HlyD family type I secretion periplasmic adaptor subunit [Gammaproteobacteria bacterium]